MKTLVGLGVALILSSALLAQHNGNFVGQPVLKGGFGSVVFPGGTAATTPGIQRNFGSFVSPLGGPRLVIPRQGSHNGRVGVGAPLVYSYPMFGGGYGYGYGSGYGYGPTDAAPSDQQPPQGNTTVIYPPQPAPIIINQYGVGDPNSSTARPRMYEMPSAPPEDASAPAPEATRYLLAFKDHTIYSAVAYWVDGETLHYFTSGNTHNQASLSLIDHDLTVRLNRESGVDIKLPDVRQ